MRSVALAVLVVSGCGDEIEETCIEFEGKCAGGSSGGGSVNPGFEPDAPDVPDLLVSACTWTPDPAEAGGRPLVVTCTVCNNTTAAILAEVPIHATLLGETVETTVLFGTGCPSVAFPPLEVAVSAIGEAALSVHIDPRNDITEQRDDNNIYPANIEIIDCNNNTALPVFCGLVTGVPDPVCRGASGEIVPVPPDRDPRCEDDSLPKMREWDPPEDTMTAWRVVGSRTPSDLTFQSIVLAFPEEAGGVREAIRPARLTVYLVPVIDGELKSELARSVDVAPIGPGDVVEFLQSSWTIPTGYIEINLQLTVDSSLPLVTIDLGGFPKTFGTFDQGGTTLTATCTFEWPPE